MENESQSVVAQWNEVTLEAIREGSALPTATTYQLHLVSSAVYDAWAAFADEASGQYADISTDLSQTDAHKAEAVSFAAFAALSALFPDLAPRFEAFLVGLGYDPADAQLGVQTAAGVGTQAANTVFAARMNDGSNAQNDFADTTGYTPVNAADPTSAEAPGGAEFDPNAWQPLRVPTGTLTDENGVPIFDNADPSTFVDQTALTPHWGEVTPFALLSGNQFRPDARPQLGDTSVYVDGNGLLTTGDAAYRAQVADVLATSADLTTEQKVIAEYWADGPRTESPPGHWNQIAQDIALREGHGIDEDAKMFFALNAAIFDSGIATWEAKYAYDYVRPQSAIRDLYFDQTVEAWGGVNQGRQEILGQEWQPYQNVTFVTPPFPEFVSGHSTFSMAAANTIASFVGSDQYYDGTTLGTYDLDDVPGVDLLGQFVATELVFEDFGEGPPVVLQWETLTEAALEAGASRIYGGIHIQDGNLRGLEVGRAVAENAQMRWEALFANGGDDIIDMDPEGGVAIAGAGDDRVIGSLLEDRIEGGSGNDMIDGRDGFDYAVFSGRQQDYEISIGASEITVSDTRAMGTGSDALSDIEALEFSDFVVDFFDVQSATTLSAAAFKDLVEVYVTARDTAPDAFTLLTLAEAFVGGGDLASIADNLAIEGAIFAGIPLEAENGLFVDAAYQQVLDRTADAEGKAFWVSQLDSGAIERGALVFEMLAGARANLDGAADVQTIEDKTEIGVSYAILNGLTDTANAQTVLAAYDRDDAAASLAEALALVSGFADTAAGNEVTVEVVGLADDPLFQLV
ncbi:MAG: DUF6851 domain-containing protein [Pseudomonadota bacterium]